MALCGMLLLGATAGCHTDDDAQGRCTAGSCVAGEDGWCEANGYCSYAIDVDHCASTRAWGADAPVDLAGRCVRAEPAADCGCEDDGNPCTRERCAAGRCVHPPDYDWNQCRGGLCHQGQCCTGCWDGASCRPGDTVEACGGHGYECDPCPASDACYQYSCQGSCVAELLGGAGCPPCGAQDEPCCAGDTCDADLACQAVGCGEDCLERLCQPDSP